MEIFPLPWIAEARPSLTKSHLSLYFFLFQLQNCTSTKNLSQHPACSMDIFSSYSQMEQEYRPVGVHFSGFSLATWGWMCSGADESAHALCFLRTFSNAYAWSWQNLLPRQEETLSAGTWHRVTKGTMSLMGHTALSYLIMII